MGSGWTSSVLTGRRSGKSLREKIYALRLPAGLPLSPRDLGLTGADTAQALVGSRDIRDKYLTSSMLWDLGLLEQAAKELQTMVDAGRL